MGDTMNWQISAMLMGLVLGGMAVNSFAVATSEINLSETVLDQLVIKDTTYRHIDFLQAAQGKLSVQNYNR